MTGSAKRQSPERGAGKHGFWKPKPAHAFAPCDLPWRSGIAMFSLYVIYPIIASMWLSFYDWDGLGEKVWLGTQNYVELFDDDAFYTSLKNNIIWLALYMFAVPAGLFIALFLNQTVFGIRIYKSLFFFPFVISQVVVGLIFSWFYAPQFRPVLQSDRMDHRHRRGRARR